MRRNKDGYRGQCKRCMYKAHIKHHPLVQSGCSICGSKSFNCEKRHKNKGLKCPKCSNDIIIKASWVDGYQRYRCVKCGMSSKIDLFQPDSPRYKNYTIPTPKLKVVATLIFCKCGCGQKRLSHDSHGRPRFYINGHQNRLKMLGKVRLNIRGKNHHNWKGGRIIKDGYVWIKTPNHPRVDFHGYVAEDVLVVERKLGRFLKKGEIVHHKNHKKGDNRPSNLKLATRQQHTTIHQTEICLASNIVRYNRIINRGVKCPGCGSNYVIKNATQGWCQDCGKYFKAPWAPKIPIIERHCAHIKCHNKFQTTSQKKYCCKPCNDAQYRLDNNLSYLKL